MSRKVEQTFILKNLYFLLTQYKTKTKKKQKKKKRKKEEKNCNLVILKKMIP
jgi:hypothetical protein